MHLVFALKCHGTRPNALNAPKTRTQEIDGKKKIDDAHENSLLNCELDGLK